MINTVLTKMTEARVYNLEIDDDFRNLIRPLMRQEYLQLEANLISDGCLTPIIIWNGVIVDGHNRYEICQKHQIPFRTEERSFDCKEEAIAWICANQLGRRNLSEETRKFLIGMQYENEKIANEKKNRFGTNQYSDSDTKAEGEEQVAEFPSRNKTAFQIANKYHVSRSTVEKYANYTRALETIGRKEPKLVPKILSGRYKISHNGVMELAALPAADVQSINRKLELTGPDFVRYQATRKEIQQIRKHDPHNSPEPAPSVKDMPEYDPDAEVTGLSLTIPSWSSSMSRVEKATDFNAISDSARHKLQNALLDLQNSALHMLNLLKGKQ